MELNKDKSLYWRSQPGIATEINDCFENSPTNCLIIPDAIYVEGWFNPKPDDGYYEHGWIETPEGVIELTLPEEKLYDTLEYFPIHKYTKEEVEVIFPKTTKKHPFYQLKLNEWQAESAKILNI